MEPLMIIEPTYDETRFVLKSDTEKATLEKFRDPCCLLIVNPNDEKSRPVECPKCHHLFCLQCATDLVKRKAACPICRSTFKPTKMNDKLVSTLGSLTITCRYESGGCKFTSKFSEIESHERKCKYATKDLMELYSKGRIKIQPGGLENQTLEAFKFIISKLHCGCGVANSLKIVYDFRYRPGSRQLYLENQFECNICLTMQRMTTAGVIHCDWCKFDICDECAEVIAEDYERFSCLENHVMQSLFPRSNQKPQKIVCNICKFQDSMTRGCWNCKTCNWNVCRDCNLNPLKCLSGHELHRFKDLTFYGTGLYAKNMIQCGLCKQTSKNHAAGVFHCPKCKFDVCDRCVVLARKDLQVFCPQKHVLFLEQDLRKLSPDLLSIYSQNKFECDLCKTTQNVSGMGVLHCSTCEYDVCLHCAMK